MTSELTPAQRHENSCIDAWGVNWRQRGEEKRDAEAARQRELDAARALVDAVRQVVTVFEDVPLAQRGVAYAKVPRLRQTVEVLAGALRFYAEEDE